MLSFALFEVTPNRRAIIMARIAPEKSNFFMRCNYQIEASREAHGPAVRQEQLVKAAQTRLGLRHALAGLLGVADQAVDEIGRGDHADIALHRLSACLTEIKALQDRDPGIRMAAQDLYEAAAALVVDRDGGAGAVDIRRWRLLMEANKRLKARLDNLA
jgi:hypothetical protein